MTAQESRRGFNAGKILLTVQIAICAVLLTSSLVAVSGLVRYLHAELGFQVQNAILAESDLSAGGYDIVGAAAMQMQMVDAVKSPP